MKRNTKTGTAASVLLRLSAALICIFLSARPAGAQCSGATATRPILFVPGISENSTAWGVNGAGIRGAVMSSLLSTPGYSTADAQAEYHLYFDGTNVRVAQVAFDPTPYLIPGEVASSTNIPCDARNFAISFYGWATTALAFDPPTVAEVSILTKAYELSQVLQAIAGLTYVQDSIVIAHSMGALDIRIYVEGLGAPAALAPCKQITCPMPSTVPYTGEVGHLITIDGTNAGADLAYIKDALFWISGLNVSELQPSSAVVQALNTPAGYPDGLGNDPHAQNPNPAPTIDAIIDSFSTTGSLNKTLWCRIVLWDHAFPRQAHKRNASRHI